MLWTIFCVDKPDSAAQRTELLPEHRKYLEGRLDSIVFSGPQESDDGSRMIGSLFIIIASDREQARAFIEEETLYRAGVFESVIVRRLRKGRFHPHLVDHA